MSRHPKPTEDEMQYATILHLSQFAGAVIPVAGWLVPLVMWLVKKDESDYINSQGKTAFNAIISYFIFSLLCSILIFILIGFVLLAILWIIQIVQVVQAALRASRGEPAQEYYLALQFFS